MRIQRLEATVEAYQNRMPISKQERKVIRRQGKAKVVSLLGKTDSVSYKNGYRHVFSDLWGEVKGQFNVGTLNEILEIHFTKAIHFINDWQPAKYLALEPPQTCFLCEERAGSLEVDGGGKICETCAQITGELAPEGE